MYYTDSISVLLCCLQVITRETLIKVLINKLFTPALLCGAAVPRAAAGQRCFPSW